MNEQIYFEQGCVFENYCTCCMAARGQAVVYDNDIELGTPMRAVVHVARIA